MSGNDSTSVNREYYERTTAGREVDYGLGIRPALLDGRLVVMHSGAQSRVSTMLFLVPEPRVVVVLLCNLERVRLQPLAQQIAALVAPPGGK